MNCEDMPEIGWTMRYSNQCYFYPMRDCPGWEPGIRCGRIGDQIPFEEGQTERPASSAEMEEWKNRAAIVFETWWKGAMESPDIDPTQTARRTHLDAFATGYVAGVIGIIAVTES